MKKNGDPCEFATSIHKTNGYHYMDGTSMSAPYVSGIAVLLLSENPNLSSSQIKNAILNEADTISISIQYNQFQTVKKLNAYNSIDSVHTHKYSYSRYTARQHKATCN